MFQGCHERGSVFVLLSIHWYVPCGTLDTKQVWVTLLNKGSWKENGIYYEPDFVVYIYADVQYSQQIPTSEVGITVSPLFSERLR